MVSYKISIPIFSIFAMVAKAAGESNFTDSLNQVNHENTTITNILSTTTQEPSYIRPQKVTEDTPTFAPTTLITRVKDFSRTSPKLPHMTIGTLPKPKQRVPSDVNDKTGLAPGQYRPYMVDHSRGFKVENRTSNDTNTQGTKRVPWGFFSAKNETNASTTDLSNKNFTVTATAAASGPQNNVTTNTFTEVNTSGNKTTIFEIEKSLKEFLHEIELLENVTQKELSLAPEDDEHLEENFFGNTTIVSTKTVPITPKTAKDGISLEDVFQTCDNHPSPESLAACDCVLTGTFRDDEIALVDVECFQTLTQEYENVFFSDVDPAYLLHKREWIDETPRGDLFCPVTVDTTFLDQPELIDDCFTKSEVAYIQQFQLHRELNNGQSLHRRDEDVSDFPQCPPHPLEKRDLNTSPEFLECPPPPLQKRNLGDPFTADLENTLEQQVHEFVASLSREELIEFLTELDARYSAAIAAAENAQVKLQKRDLNGFEGLEQYAQAGDTEVEKLVGLLNEDELMELMELLEEAEVQK